MSATTFTPHLKTDRVWRGMGANDTYFEGFNRSTSVELIHPYWLRVPLAIVDPGHNAMSLGDADRDALWTRYVARVTCSGMLQGVNNQVIFYGGDVPRSWLSVARELRGDSLIAYAKLLVSAVITFRAAGTPVTWVEVCEEPDRSLASSGKSKPLLTPDNYVILVRAVRAEITRRSIDPIKLLGPCLSRPISKEEYTEPYSAAFARQPSLDAWSIHVAEAPSDMTCYNAGSYGSRTYVSHQLARTVMFMKWINFDIPLYVTKFATCATRFATGINYGKGAPETVEHALRVVETLCNVVSAGASMAIPWNTTERRTHTHSNEQHDNFCLLRQDGAQRPHGVALAMVNATLPVNGFVYQRTLVHPNTPIEDETLTLAVVSGNAFGFILGRAHATDVKNGHYVFKLTSTDWIPEASSGTIYEATISLSAYPTYVSLTGANRTVAVDSTGTLSITFKELPYNCVIFGHGDVYAL